MKWIHKYQLFLFDFDGLLVNTEAIHHQAYIQMCAYHGFDLKWNFEQFTQFAHHPGIKINESIYREFPSLQEIDWKILYEEKQQIFLKRIKEQSVELMPGVAELLVQLNLAQINCCVVTNSPKNFIDSIKEKNPLLDSIPHWITREKYTFPKPHSECYQLAIDNLAKSHERIIGFEDTLKGLTALQGTKAKAVLICPETHPHFNDFKHEKITHFSSFQDITEDNSP